MSGSERFILLPIGEGAWDSAAITASSEFAGGEGANVVTARQDRGWFFDFSTPQTLTFDLGPDPPALNFVFLGGLEVSGPGLAAQHVRVEWDSDDDAGFVSPTSWGAKSYAIRADGAPAPRLDMAQPNLGLADAELPQIMAQGRLHSYFRAPGLSPGVAQRYHRLTISHSTFPDPGQRGYLPMVFGGWGWQPDGAQWAPGDLSRRHVQRPNGEVLRGWQFRCQAVLEDAYHLKLLEWFTNNGSRNRAVFWQDPGCENRFIQNCALVQVLDLSANQRAGTFRSAGVLGAESALSYSVAFNLIERFNDETES